MLDIMAEATVIDAGVDWLTITAADGDKAERLVHLGEEIIEASVAAGNYQKEAGFQGYRGAKARGVFYGVRQDGVCLRLSGETAKEYAMRVHELDPNVTRLDVQLTVKLPTDDMDWARRFIDDYRADRARANGNTQLHTQLIDAHYDGSTASICSRRSPLFIRLYDKYRESGGSFRAGTFRLEAEIKKGWGTAYFNTLAGDRCSRSASAGLMKSMLAKRGVNILCVNDMPIEAPKMPRHESDVDRQLAWLASSVAPVLQKLYAQGRHAEASSALFSWLAPDLLDS